MNALERLEKLLDREQFEKIRAIDNPPKLHEFLAGG